MAQDALSIVRSNLGLEATRPSVDFPLPGDGSPNPTIDQSLDHLMGKVKDLAPDVAVKVINTAINWEKVKHRILDKEEDFDPDKL